MHPPLALVTTQENNSLDILLACNSVASYGITWQEIIDFHVILRC